MTKPHLDGRGARRRRSCSATAALREGGKRRGHGGGRHHPRPQRGFFPLNVYRPRTPDEQTKSGVSPKRPEQSPDEPRTTSNR